MNNTAFNEQIKLTLPVNAAYVSAARLTASSVANRLGFDIEEIEDIKAAVSEACTYIIKKHAAAPENNFKILFDFSQEILNITITIKNSLINKIEEEEMSLLVIKALADNLSIDCQGGSFCIAITKKHVQDSF